ncbi:MAG: S1C family serine protease [Polyangiaceae bacterium]|nr:S1C family serine protease [Polyangiaceae bacterium]
MLARWSLPLGCFVARVATVLLLAGCATSASRPAAQAPPEPAAVTGVPSHLLSPAEIAARALPSVVTIRTSDSLGTGFVVRPDGWIATNLHVIVGAAHAKVTLRGERELDVVDVLAMSAEHDLALLRVEARGLSALPLGDSDAMRPGDPVVAIGNPLGLEDTVSNGLVSARRKGDDGTEFLQISAPIAPGSSGGPIFNDRGEVVGIAVAILEEGQNLNFGVPARYLTPLIRKAAPIPFAQFAKLMARLRGETAPKVERSVPHHPLTLLDGCSEAAQRLMAQMIEDAVEVGAPLYNAGKAGACYHVYDGAASDLVRKLPLACRGPARALGDAQRRAATLPSAVAQAWAMRDAFDGLIDVIARKRGR